MIVYFDESYACKEKLLLGALFLPSKRERAWLHCAFRKVKQKEEFWDNNGVLKEIKYSKIDTPKKLRVAKKAIDLFSRCQESYFRACVVPYNEEELKKVGRQKGVPLKLKEAMLYTKSTYLLIRNTIPGVRNASLMMDEITRANGDRFDEIIRYKLANGDDAIFNHIGYISSKAEETHTIQICDLLLGAILNELYPTKGKRGNRKNEFREYVKKKINLPSLGEDYWKNFTKAKAEAKHPKYTVRYYGVPYKYLSE